MKKTFDCIEMKRQGAARLMMLLAPMSLEEQLVFWQQRTEHLQQLLRQDSSQHCSVSAKPFDKLRDPPVPFDKLRERLNEKRKTEQAANL